jgi:hypothetical protein
VSNFLKDLHARIQEAERIINHQNENLAALRHLLRNEVGESVSNSSTPAPVTAPSISQPRSDAEIDFKGKLAEIVLALVQQTGDGGTRPRDIAEILIEHKLVRKGSNTVYSHLSELKKKGLVKQKAEGLYVASAKPSAAKPVTSIPAEKAQKKRSLSAAGREAIRKAQKARWAGVRKTKG